jgi:hypothetical protein
MKSTIPSTIRMISSSQSALSPSSREAPIGVEHEYREQDACDEAGEEWFEHGVCSWASTERFG